MPLKQPSLRSDRYYICRKARVKSIKLDTESGRRADMLYDTAIHYWRLLATSSATIVTASAITWIATGLAITYTSWYTWTFKLALLWRPSEPKPLPYLIPCKQGSLSTDTRLILDCSRR